MRYFVSSNQMQQFEAAGISNPQGQHWYQSPQEHWTLSYWAPMHHLEGPSSPHLKWVWEAGGAILGANKQETCPMHCCCSSCPNVPDQMCLWHTKFKDWDVAYMLQLPSSGTQEGLLGAIKSQKSVTLPCWYVNICPEHSISWNPLGALIYFLLWQHFLCCDNTMCLVYQWYTLKISLQISCLLISQVCYCLLI